MLKRAMKTLLRIGGGCGATRGGAWIVDAPRQSVHHRRDVTVAACGDVSEGDGACSELARRQPLVPSGPPRWRIVGGGKNYRRLRKLFTRRLWCRNAGCGRYGGSTLRRVWRR
ncbi:MAG: hypothetical protein EPO42_01835 [Gallionellaceae bacterium]|nr:MAG: hypothetical protein EPO42_01835 [Gallionellaceae bacterium]